MGKKTIKVPTGDYAIKMPSIVSITADVPVIQNTKEVVQHEGINWPRVILGLTFCFLMAVAIILVLCRKQGGKLPAFDKFCIIFCPTPTPAPVCHNRVLYVTVWQTYLYDEPQEGRHYEYPRYILRYRDPVEDLNQSHQFPNGKTWIKVRYVLVAGEHQEEREGWVDVEDITIE